VSRYKSDLADKQEGDSG